MILTWYLKVYHRCLMFSFVPFCSCVFQCPGSVNRILWAHSAFLHYLLLPLNGECAIISNVVSTIVKIYQMFVHCSEHFLCQATNITVQKNHLIYQFSP